MNKSANKIIGQFGEDKAAEFLKKHGYKILERNFRYSKIAEIDIIAKDYKTIVFVEVKTRSTTNFGHPYEAVSKAKLENIFQAALYYLAQTQEKYENYRIDLISVLGKENPKIEHLKNISLN